MKTKLNIQLRSAPCLALASCLLMASAYRADAQDSTTKPDNSAQNKNQHLTADKQANAKNDRILAANVRKAIIADKGLSTYAHNVKIIVHDGTVTLKGPVKSDDEKHKVKSDAESATAQAQVIDQLTVKQ